MVCNNSYEALDCQKITKMFYRSIFLIMASLWIQECISKSFKIDYTNDTFLLDGQPFVYTSGSMHYFRVPHFYWTDRLIKLKAAGLDAVQTYVAWNLHEIEPSVYDFTGQQDIVSFFKKAQDAGLFVILRPGPYICAEWDYGGFPAWLLSTNETFKIRTMDNYYMNAVERWFNVFLPIIRPFLYSNGGPIIMVQVENEYGSYDACDHDYMNYLAQLMRYHLGNEIVLFTTDGNGLGYLKCGFANDTYATVDFGVTNDVNGAFSAMKQWNQHGPLVNSEFYTGWLDYWGQSHSTTSTSGVIQTLSAMQDINASVNMYMFEGGTNFQYMNGADPTFQVIPTSYDYDAPLTEAGDITDKYLAIRDLMLKKKKSLPPIPKNTKKISYGNVQMFRLGSVLQLLSYIATDPNKKYYSVYPLNSEQIQHYYGFIIYRHILQKSFASSLLEIPTIRDRAYIIINSKLVGILDRNLVSALIGSGLKGQTLDIIVENQGRLNYGSQINDNKKGILGNVTFDNEVLKNWEMIPLNITRLFDDLSENISMLYELKGIEINLYPAIYYGSFTAENPMDTYFSPCGWTKGQFFLNGYNLGRYNPTAGPQVTLYVPSGYLSIGINHFILLELEGHNCNHVTFIDKPIINSNCFTCDIIEKRKNKKVEAYHGRH